MRKVNCRRFCLWMCGREIVRRCGSRRRCPATWGLQGLCRRAHTTIWQAKVSTAGLRSTRSSQLTVTDIRTQRMRTCTIRHRQGQQQVTRCCNSRRALWAGPGTHKLECTCSNRSGHSIHGTTRTTECVVG